MIAVDIGGVLSKYPDILRPLLQALIAVGVEVVIVTDMERTVALETLRLNGFDFVPERDVISADYQRYGEGCKAVVCDEIGADILIDDHVAYVAESGAAIRLLVMPDASRPYYHDTWKRVGGEPDFGRRVYRKETP
jgi:hypothetical protein